MSKASAKPVKVLKSKAPQPSNGRRPPHSQLVNAAAKLSASNKRLVEARSKGFFGSKGEEIDDVVESGMATIAGLRKLLNVETKHYDVNSSITASRSGTTHDWTSNIVQGDTDNSRDGDSLKLRRVEVFLRPSWNSAGLTHQYVRVIIVRSHDEAVTAAQVNQQDATANAAQGFLNWDGKLMFKVLLDKHYHLDLYHGAYMDRFLIDLNDHVQFSAGSTTVNNGAIQILAWSNDSTNQPTLDYGARIAWVDN